MRADRPAAGSASALHRAAQRRDPARHLPSGIDVGRWPLPDLWEIWPQERWQRTDTYIFDPACMAAARPAPDATAAWEWGYGIHRQRPHAVWTGARGRLPGRRADRMRILMVVGQPWACSTTPRIGRRSRRPCASTRCLRVLYWNMAPLVDGAHRSLRSELDRPPAAAAFGPARGRRPEPSAAREARLRLPQRRFSCFSRPSRCAHPAASLPRRAAPSCRYRDLGTSRSSAAATSRAAIERKSAGISGRSQRLSLSANCFAAARRLRLERAVAIAGQHRGPRDHQAGKAQFATAPLPSSALDAVVEDRGMGVGAHRADQAQPAGAGDLRRAGHREIGIEIDRPESRLAPGHLDGGPESQVGFVDGGRGAASACREVARTCAVSFGWVVGTGRRPRAWTAATLSSAKSPCRISRPTRPDAPARRTVRCALMARDATRESC